MTCLACLDGDAGTIWIYACKDQAKQAAATMPDRTTIKPITIRAAGVTVRRFALVIHWS